MNILIVTAHPSSQGFTHRIADTYQKSAQKAGHRTELIDLYKTTLQQDFLKFENIKNWPPDPTRNKWQEKIIWADELVLIHPLWWFDAPAIMKNWFDQNFTSGFAYRFQKNGFPKKLLKGKTARVFITADGPRLIYFFLSHPFRKAWIYGRLRFCGYRVKKFLTLYSKRKRSPQYLEKFLQKVDKIGRKTKI